MSPEVEVTVLVNARDGFIGTVRCTMPFVPQIGNRLEWYLESNDEAELICEVFAVSYDFAKRVVFVACKSEDSRQEANDKIELIPALRFEPHNAPGGQRE